MSILISATFEQEQKIQLLSEYLGKQVFARYFPLDFSKSVQQKPLFYIDDNMLHRIETLQDASHVINALNTIISILEAHSLTVAYENFFEESVHTLAAYHIHFPFPFSFFLDAKPMRFA